MLFSVFQTQFLNRLASAHRGAVRALKSLVDVIGDLDISKGLPKSYHELTLVVRQLSLCCAQLEIAGESGVPDSVMHLINEMNVSYCRYIHVQVL